jgi:diacylglycerol kinase (ATP)
MRAAAILGLGCSPKDLRPFQTDSAIDWQMGMPTSNDNADAVLLFGGDGTIHRHLGHLVKLGLPVLIVPAGSGNDFATSLGLKRVRDSLGAWNKFCKGTQNVRRVDLGVITPLPDDPHNSVPGTTYFSCAAGVGLDGEVARRANNLPRWLRGHGGYALSMVRTIPSFAPFPMKLTTCTHEGQAIVRRNGPTMLAVFANTPLYGGGMKVAPNASMDDGLLDVCVVEGLDPFSLFCLFPTVYAGRHLNARNVHYFQTQNVRVETEHPFDVYADGEYVCQTPVEVSIQRSALKVITL